MSRIRFVTLEGPSSTVDERTHAAFPFPIMTITIIPNCEIIFRTFTANASSVVIDVAWSSS
jgi:hypothetical protein